MKKAASKKIMADLQAIGDDEGKDELLQNLEIALTEYVEDRQALQDGETFTNLIILLSQMSGADERLLSVSVRRLLRIFIIDEIGVDPVVYIAEYEQKRSGRKLN